MAEDKDPLVEADSEEDEQESGEEELPESPQLADHSVETSGGDVDLSSGGVVYERGPNGKLRPVD